MKKLILVAISYHLTLLLPSLAQAGSATWDLNPTSGDWNTAGNWTPATVPNGASDTATFGPSNTTDVSISANTEVNGVTFTSAAPLYHISTNPLFSAGFTLTISGTGITNNSPNPPVFFFEESSVQFLNTSTAGSGGINMNGGSTNFFDTSTAGSADILIDGCDVNFFNTSTAGSARIGNGSGNANGISFHDSSTAGNAILQPGEVSLINFSDHSSAGNATVIAPPNIGLGVNFTDFSTAANATIIGNGSIITFSGSSQGGTARIELAFHSGFMVGSFLDISGHSAPSVTIGSIEGEAEVDLGANNLTVGSNNLSTTFSGVIQDGNSFVGGSLTKIGTGKLELTGASTYTGGTTVSGGTLLVNNTSGSGAGTGAIQVTGGTLGGTGTIAGAVTVGIGSGGGALISPGASAGTLTIQNTLTLNSDAIYRFELNSSTAAADRIVAAGVTINGASFLFSDLGHGRLSFGARLIIIDNTSASPISGSFSNLLDNSVFTENGNTYQVSYEGGTGNDLAVTVVSETSTWVMLSLGLAMIAGFAPRHSRSSTRPQ
jgi:autotransporter-associated beta strand protein